MLPAVDTERVSSFVECTGQSLHPLDPGVGLNARADDCQQRLDHYVHLLWQKHVPDRRRVVLLRHVVGYGEPRERVELICHPVRHGSHLHQHRLQLGAFKIEHRRPFGGQNPEPTDGIGPPGRILVFGIHPLGTRDTPAIRARVPLHKAVHRSLQLLAHANVIVVIGDCLRLDLLDAFTDRCDHFLQPLQLPQKYMSNKVSGSVIPRGPRITAVRLTNLLA